MPIPDLFQSPVAQIDLTKFGPSHWNAVTELLEALLGGPEADGLVLTKDATSDTGATWQSGFNRTLHVNTTSAGTPATTSESDLWLYSLPADTLLVDGQTLRITVFGSTTVTARNKTARLYFGGTVVSTVVSGTAGAAFRIVADIIRVGATAQLATAHGLFNIANINPVVTTPGETLSDAVTIKLTGQNAFAAADDLVFRGAIIELGGG
jgi:hypothetical protein